MIDSQQTGEEQPTTTSEGWHTATTSRLPAYPNDLSSTQRSKPPVEGSPGLDIHSGRHRQSSDGHQVENNKTGGVSTLLQPIPAIQHKPEPGPVARDGACRVESVTPPVLPHHRKTERKTGEDGDETTRVSKMGFKPAGLASSYFVKVYMGRKERLMIMDSGCTHSVMPVELFYKLDEEAKKTVMVQGGSGRLADGAMIASHGKMTVEMKIHAAAKTTKSVPVRQ